MADEHYGRNLWREHTCRTCGKTFKSSRIDAAFCSGRCRMYWCRNGKPYPNVGTPAQVGPGLFDSITAETGMAEDQIREHLDKQTVVVENRMNPPEAIAGARTGAKRNKSAQKAKAKRKNPKPAKGQTLKPKLKKKRK